MCIVERSTMMPFPLRSKRVLRRAEKIWQFATVRWACDLRR